MLVTGFRQTHLLSTMGYHLLLVCLLLDQPLSYVVVNIYRSPETSRQLFYNELSDLLTKLCDSIESDRFATCDHFNCGDVEPTSITFELLSITDVHSLRQLVTPLTRQTSTTGSLPRRLQRVWFRSGLRNPSSPVPRTLGSRPRHAVAVGVL